MILDLKSQSRQLVGKKVESLRQQDLIPAVIYGHGVEAKNLAIAAKEFGKIFSQSGESTLVDLTIDEQKPVKVLIQAVQRDPISSKVIHVDFHQVRMDEKIITEVPLKFVGEAGAVKSLGGVFVHVLDHVKIECLPTELLSEIVVDISVLANFENKIHIKDLKVGAGVKILGEAEETVALVEAPRTEQEMADLEATATATVIEPEVAGKTESAAATATPAAEEKK
ncbi:MAG: 50S ribosomal protein L25 [Candidatus Buchananbacteria bacterium]